MPVIKVSKEEFEISSESTALEILKYQKKKDGVLVCRINGKLSDLSAQVREGDSVEFLTFEDEDAKQVFWHSSAHILGYAIKNIYPKALLSSGPPTESGFFYDVWLERPFTQGDYGKLEKEIQRIIKRNFTFKKLTKTKKELLEQYAENPYKTHFVEKKVVGQSSVYDIGEFSDFCEGPHVPSTSSVRAFKIMKNSSSYFLGDSSNDTLQRIFGISFPNKEMMAEFLDIQEKAKSRDHRKIGLDMNLFFFHPYSPGGCFFLPDGAVVYKNLVSFLQDEYRKRGFQEVITPNLFSLELWEESGHLQNYKENMFLVEDSMGLKPMNCPGHCIMFRHGERTYKELPMRLADFGVLHRNELRGTLSGLTRVRRFQQDDAHIFCAADQIQEEIKGSLEFLEYVYERLGFEFDLFLSTRPEKFLGKAEDWEKAEEALRKGLGTRRYRVNEGDGAFYGPKIDIQILDALKRKHQCATIQLDFQLPQRFNLKFKKSDGSYEAPVIIHRAILGSIERMMAILIENYGKRLPFWITPRQIALVPISSSVEDYATEILRRFSSFHIRKFDEEGLTLSKKIRNAQLGGYSVIVIVGEKEKKERKLSVRVGHETKLYEIEELFESLRWRMESRADLPVVSDLTISTKP